MNAFGKNPKANHRRIGHWSFVIGHSALAALIAGCGASPATTQPASVSDRQNAALKDPFSYGPKDKDVKTSSENKTRDDTLKGEWERFWNP